MVAMIICFEITMKCNNPAHTICVGEHRPRHAVAFDPSPKPTVARYHGSSGCTMALCVELSVIRCDYEATRL